MRLDLPQYAQVIERFPEFTRYIDTYAEILVSHGLNLQKGQTLFIDCEVAHRDFAMLVAEKAYETGARYVDVRLGDPRLRRIRILSERDTDLTYMPQYIDAMAREIVDDNNARLYLCGMENMDTLTGLDPQALSRVEAGWSKAMQYFYDKGIDRSVTNWCLAAVATEGWAHKVYPDLNTNEAHVRLWQDVFAFTRANRDDGFVQCQKHNDRLVERGKRITELGIRELHFTGPGTDLRMTLSEKAQFISAAMKNAQDIQFFANEPSEEVFTTPDYRGTYGRVRITRPFLVNGNLITDLNLVFENGKIVNFTCNEGEEVFRAHIETDEGASMLGEVALVGVDSPIFQSGIVFLEILLDENAACHIAIGSGYKDTYRNFRELTDADFAKLGCNKSVIHTDMMISDENTTVTGITKDGVEIVLVSNGAWEELFL